MNIITLTSDYGIGSHYSSMMKGRLSGYFSYITLVEITDRHEPFDIIESAYIFNLIKSNFPSDTLHLFMVNTADAVNGQLLLAKSKNLSVLVPDNGSISMIFEETTPDVFLFDHSLFSGQEDWEVTSEAVMSLLKSSGQSDQRFIKFDDYQRKNLIRPVMNESKLTGTIMFNDSLGHAHTNIHASFFESFIKQHRFRILLSRHEWVENIHKNITEVRDGEPFAAFNNQGYLYLGVKKGKSNQLMNLTKSRAIRIELI